MKRLQDLCKQYNAALECHIYFTNEFQNLPVGQWNTIMYLKLLIPQILSDHINRCLFLDVDMIINTDINPLYNFDLGNSVIAAAEDMPDCIKIKARLGLDPKDAYINSGVMVCDLQKWRILEQEKAILEFTQTISNIITNEQDVIALYFKGKILFLPIKWNMTNFYFNRKPKIFKKYLSQLKDARRHPGIIHFASPIKPWFKDCQHPYKNLYKFYLSKTAWKNYKFPLSEKRSFMKSLKRTIRLFCNRIGIIRDSGYNMI